MEHIESSNLWLYLDGESSPEQSAKIKEHLSNCEACNIEYELLTQIEVTLHVIEDETPSFEFSKAVIQKIETGISLERKSTFWTKLLVYTIFGGFGLAFIVTIIVGAEISLDISHVEDILNRQTILLALMACIILWGFYFIDHICKKIFSPLDYAKPV